MIGVLALQGGFAAHVAALRRLGHRAGEIRRAQDLGACDGLVLPGGESSTQLLLLAGDGLDTALAAWFDRDLPVLGTCAGLILLASSVIPPQRSLARLDVDVRRNGYGRQQQSCEARADETGLPLALIRAPRVLRTGPKVSVAARWQGDPVWVTQGRVHGTTFHPELTSDTTVHEAVFGRA